MGEDLSDVNELPEALRRCLGGPDRFAGRRALYRQLVFGDLTDGRSAERLCECVSRLSAEVPTRTVAARSMQQLRDARRRARQTARRVRAFFELSWPQKKAS
jgi:hypothetical protein